MPKLENKEANVPKCKAKITRKKAFSLLISLCQSYEDISSKHHTRENYFTLFKELYVYHKEMDEIEKNTTVSLDHFDTDVGLRSSTGFAGLKNFGAT
jgi:heme oxygenase